MRLYFVALLALGSVASFADPGIKMSNYKCPDDFLRYHYPLLVNDEPALGKAYEKLFLAAGTNLLSSCIVQHPTKNGVAIYGPRTAWMESHWTTSEVVNGIRKSVFHQHGIKVVYELRKGTFGDLRIVQSLQVCRIPSACSVYGFPNSDKSGSPTTPASPTL